jgi:hypothetical protein
LNGAAFRRRLALQQFFTSIFSLPDLSQEQQISAFGSQEVAAYAYSDQ